jgi:hypothetical protein
MNAPTTRRSVELVDGGEVSITETPRSEFRAAQVNITLRGVDANARFTAGVDVFGPHWAFGQMVPAQVNWSGCGSQDPILAVAMAAVLVKAARIAKRLQPSEADERLADDARAYERAPWGD